MVALFDDVEILLLRGFEDLDHIRVIDAALVNDFHDAFFVGLVRGLGRMLLQDPLVADAVDGEVLN